MVSCRLLFCSDAILGSVSSTAEKAASLATLERRRRGLGCRRPTLVLVVLVLLDVSLVVFLDFIPHVVYICSRCSI